MSVTTRTPDAAPASTRLSRILNASQDQRSVALALLLVCALSAIFVPRFAEWSNITNLIGTNSVALMLAIGSTFVVISGGIDLSVVAMTASSAMVFGLVLLAGVPAVPAVLAAVAAGALLGAVNGLLISRAGLSFLVVTLGMSSIATTAGLVLSDGTTLSVFEVPAFSVVHDFATADIAGMPILILFDIAVVALSVWVLGNTRFGRAVFAVGANAEAARLNGIDVRTVRLVVYLLCGLAAGVASVVQVGRLTGSSPQIDPALLNGVLAAVLIGGTAFSGGRGSVWGTVLGVLFLGVVQNVMTLADVNSFWRQGVNGVLLILAVALSVRTSGGLGAVLRRLGGRPAAHAPN